MKFRGRMVSSGMLCHVALVRTRAAWHNIPEVLMRTIKHNIPEDFKNSEETEFW
jgi:hypothetical protein